MRKFVRVFAVSVAVSVAMGAAHLAPSAIAGDEEATDTKGGSAVTCNISCSGPQQPISVLLEDSFECCWACANYCNESCTVGGMTCG